MGIGDIVRSKRSGKLYRVVEEKIDEIKGYTCEPVKREDSRYYFRESEIDVVTEKESMMALDEVIKHYEERVDCTERGMQNKQLAEWLKELKELKERNSVEQCILHLSRNGYIVKKWTKDMQEDSDECVALDEKGKSKDCGECSCLICLMQ